MKRDLIYNVVLITGLVAAAVIVSAQFQKQIHKGPHFQQQITHYACLTHKDYLSDKPCNCP